jgi:hypothetical protein
MHLFRQSPILIDSFWTEFLAVALAGMIGYVNIYENICKFVVRNISRYVVGRITLYRQINDRQRNRMVDSRSSRLRLSAALSAFSSCTTCTCSGVNPGSSTVLLMTGYRAVMYIVKKRSYKLQENMMKLYGMKDGYANQSRDTRRDDRIDVYGGVKEDISCLRDNLMRE